MKFAIGIDRYSLWHEKFIVALDKKIKSGLKIEYEAISLEDHDWIQKLEGFDAVIWKSDYMGAESSIIFKEKIFFIEQYLGKRVFPNYSSAWHFESKIAQSYMLEKFCIKTPKTIVSFNYNDALAQLQQAQMPLVVKLSHGAGSSNVSLVENRSKIRKKLVKILSLHLWKQERQKYGNSLKFFTKGICQGWFWNKVVMTLLNQDNFRYIYWQEFAAGNEGDLRITVIGDRFAYAFWRKNRPNDFRASGSGNIDYDREVPENVIRYCIDINKKLHFDSMAYDILFNEKGFVVVEISYTYVDSAPYKCRGYYELIDDNLLFKEGHFWPQELWVEWALISTGVVN